jgi:hypothetical protein
MWPNFEDDPEANDNLVDEVWAGLVTGHDMGALRSRGPQLQNFISSVRLCHRIRPLQVDRLTRSCD